MNFVTEDNKSEHTRASFTATEIDNMDSNLFRCHSCGGYNIIAEEVDSHQCKRRVVDYRIVDNILWLSDGEK
jgi:hypothetical protein